MKLPPEEPAAGPWRVEPVAALAATLSRRLTQAVPGAAVVHTELVVATRR